MSIKRVLGLTLLVSSLFTPVASAADSNILGVWELTKFVTVQDNTEVDWCAGAYGSIAYLPGQMTVAINCDQPTPDTNAADLGGILFYSGPFELDTKTNEVIHRVRNFSHPSLNKVFRRQVEMDSPDHLRLVGDLAPGHQVIVEWTRLERFSYDDADLPGVYDLVGSENTVEGQADTIPFCNGFNGSIVYTPGGYVAVSINCGEKEGSAEQPADQFGRMYFYAGTYSEEDSIITHFPVNASVRGHIGHPVKRQAHYDGDVLTLAGTNGSPFIATWKKLRSFVCIR